MSISAGSYTIVSVGVPTLAVTFDRDNYPVIVKPNILDITQTWILTTSNGQYFFKPAPSVQYASASKGDIVGTEVKTSPSADGWVIEPATGGAYTIRTPAYNNVWTFTGNGTAVTGINLATNNPANPRQKWRFVPS